MNNENMNFDQEQQVKEQVQAVEVEDKELTRTKAIVMVLLIIMFLSIGYALLSSSLNVEGNATIAPMKWSIHFENVSENEGSIEAINPAEIKLGTRVDFDVLFNEIGEEYSFDVDVVNDGTIDAMLSDIIMEGIESDDTALEFSVTYKDGTPIKINDLLKAGERETYTVTVKQNDVVLSESIDKKAYALLFDCEYLQATDEAVARK